MWFLRSVSKSPFPFDTGKQAVKFSAWLKEKDKDLMEMGTYLAEDIQCGDTFHLFALISSGELSISPSLPDNGIGEADDLRSDKRKSDASESSFSDTAKKLKSSFGCEGEIISRREKGFPGINISVHHTAVSSVDLLDLFKDNDNNNNDQCFEGNFQLNMGQSSNCSLTDQMLETFNSRDPVTEKKNHTPWEAMAGYARRLTTVPYNQEQECAVCAEVFMIVYAAIQKAGDQGLSMGEISQVINLPGINALKFNRVSDNIFFSYLTSISLFFVLWLSGADVEGLIVDALQAFGKALKVLLLCSNCL
jgi:general transcription factor 3C polypeptide 1